MGKYKIKKGEVYLCLKDYVMDDGEIAFKNGESYVAIKKDILTSEIFQEHEMDNDPEFQKHFIRQFDKKGRMINELEIKLKNGRIFMNGKKYDELNKQERLVFEILIKQEKHQVNKILNE